MYNVKQVSMVGLCNLLILSPAKLKMSTKKRCTGCSAVRKSEFEPGMVGSCWYMSYLLYSRRHDMQTCTAAE